MDEETKRCPFCGESILAVAMKCKHCGSMLAEPPPQQQTYAPPPQGYAMPPGAYVVQGQPAPVPPAKTSGCAWAALVILLVGGACFVMSAVGRERRASQPGQVAGGETRQYVAESCSQVVHIFGSRSGLTELQQTDRWSQYDGRWVRWTARAGSVSQTFGTISMQFRCGGESLLLDGTASFVDSARPQLMQVHEGDSVGFEGRLIDHGRLLGLHIADATITSR